MYAYIAYIYKQLLFVVDSSFSHTFISQVLQSLAPASDQVHHQVDQDAHRLVAYIP